jgi:solute carrier family 8 (sodium/calcium exchanger)
LQFQEGDAEKYIEVVINDDDSWEPDEDFHVQLYEDTGENGELIELKGKDTNTRVTIIDDDKPGQIYFEATKNIKAVASEGFVEVKLLRKNGGDGRVTVDYQTLNIDNSDSTATPDVDYVPAKGTICFEHNEMSKEIRITILPKDDDEERDESFGL